jgi:hypothetical protein
VKGVFEARAEGVVKIGQLILSMRPVGPEVATLAQWATTPTTRIFLHFLFQYTCVGTLIHAVNLVMSLIGISLLQVKNRPRDLRYETCIYSQALLQGCKH